MRPDIFLATIGRGSNGSNALEVTEDRAAVTAESQDNIINRVNNVSQYGPSWHYVPGIGVAGTAYAEVPDRALGDLAFTRASSKTRTNAAGVVQTIGNNVPPHDYRNADGTLSSCPRLLLEPQRTNLALWSEDFDNATWIKDNSFVTANTTTSPRGFTNADTYAGNGGISQSRFIYQSQSFVSGTQYTISIYAKKNTNNFIQITGGSVVFGATAFANFDLNNGVLGTVGVTATARIENAGNGWYRCSMTAAAISTTTSAGGVYGLITSATAARVEANTLSTSVFIWGAQLEAGAYATTFIPTTTAAVTRLADLAIKTGVSSLIGQTSGAIFFDYNKTVENLSMVSIDTDANNRIFLESTGGNNLRLRVISSGTTTVDNSSTTLVSGRNKIAIAYANNDVVMYHNGTQVFSDNSATIPSTANIRIGANVSNLFPLADGVNQAALFPTRLTNAQLAQLTTL